MNLFKLLPFIVLLVSCASGVENGEAVNLKELKEPLIQKNIRITKEESRLMDRYVERHKWNMEESGTGLRYSIYKKGFGMQAKEGMKATVEYEIRLLDGSLCYSSVEKGPRAFTIGRDHVEAGLHEGVQLMVVGDRAKFIVPAYLAHGLTGDGNRIPPMSSLVVDLHLLRLD